MDGIKNPGQPSPPGGQDKPNPPDQPPAPPATQPNPQQTPGQAPPPPQPPAAPTAGHVEQEPKSSKTALWIGLVVIALLVGLGVGYMVGSA